MCVMQNETKSLGQMELRISIEEKNALIQCSIRDVAKLSSKGVSTVQRVKRLIKVQSPQ